MNIEQAKIKLLAGEKLTHAYFSEGEYIYMKSNGDIYSEDGVCHDNFWGLRQLEGWNEDWEIYTEK
jgi:hypothetical protein